MGAICDCCAEPDGRQAIIVEEVEEIESVEGGCPRPIPLNLLPPSLARRVSVFDVNLALNHTNPTRQRGRPVPNSTVLGSHRPFAEGRSYDMHPDHVGCLTQQGLRLRYQFMPSRQRGAE